MLTEQPQSSHASCFFHLKKNIWRYPLNEGIPLRIKQDHSVSNPVSLITNFGEDLQRSDRGFLRRKEMRERRKEGWINAERRGDRKEDKIGEMERSKTRKKFFEGESTG